MLLIFDFDGTLHDTKHLYGCALRKVCAGLTAEGFEVPQDLSDDSVSRYLGVNAPDMWNDFMPELPEEVKKRSSRAVGREMIESVVHGDARLFDGITQSLDKLKSDGHKLVRYLIKADTAGVTTRFTMPQKPAAILKNILDKASGEMTLRAFGTGNAVVETEFYTINCRLIEDPYPNYKGVIPQNNANVAVLDRASLISAMRRVMVVSDKTTTLIKFLFEANKVTLTSEDINYAQSAEEQLVCQYDGQPLKMGFKGSDLLELIGNLQSQEMTLKLADPSKAGLILPSEQDEGTDLLMLLMPLLINN